MFPPWPPGAKVGRIIIEYTDRDGRFFGGVITIEAGDLERFERAAEAVDLAERTIAAAKRLASLTPSGPVKEMGK